MKPKILLVEDEAPIRNSTARLLKAEGYDILIAEDGARGLELAGRDIPDLIISDVMMPELDGFGMLARLRQSEPTQHIPVLLLSALDDRTNMRKGMTLGADDYLPKPFTRDELLQAVGALLKKGDKQKKTTQRAQREAEVHVRNELTDKLKTIADDAAAAASLAKFAVKSDTARFAALPSDASAASSEARQIDGAVLVFEVRDFASLTSRLSAEEVTALLAKLLTEACVPIIDAGGRVVRFMGEGLVAVFEADFDAQLKSQTASAPDELHYSKVNPRVAALLQANSAALAAALSLALVCAQFRIWTKARFHARNLPDFLVCMGLSSGRLMEHRLVGQKGEQATISGSAYYEAIAARDAARIATWTIAATKQTVSGVKIKPRIGRNILAATPGGNGVQLTGQHMTVFEVLGADGDAPMASTMPQQRLADIEKAVRENAEITARATKQELSNSLSAVVNSAGEPVLVRGYRVHGELGKGAMAHVYRATHDVDGSDVVLKILHVKGNETSTFIKRFIQEYSLLSRLSNDNVVKIYDQGFTDEHIFIAMEYLPGGSLTERIERGIAPTTAARYIRALAGGLAAVHDQGVVHRDLKPRNILFRDSDTPVITDFGVAKDLENPLNETKAGEIFGTPYYLSPEQARSENQAVTSGADIYSLGVIFHEMLTGRRPFMADRLEALLQMHMVRDPPPLEGPVAIYETLILKMMAKAPQLRPTAAQVVTYLNQITE